MGKTENGELDEDGLTAEEAQILLDEEDRSPASDACGLAVAVAAVAF